MCINQLGRTGIDVTDFCLGTMTFGSNTDEADGHSQIDLALEHGLTFMDTAEMYPVNPVKAETVGDTETIIGNWIAKGGARDKWVLATKIAGANGGWCRDGAAISSGEIVKALEGSLKRLRTDYVDLYQLHWPNRGSYAFRQNWTYDPSKQNRAETVAHMEDVLGELQRQVEAGKIRAIGLSNESAWGMSMWTQIADANGWPRMASVQNEYSLLYRMFDTDAAEVAVNEDCGLLSYSPLAAGLLTGKYQGGAIPEGSRASVNGDLGGRLTERALEAVGAYQEVADKHGLDLMHMSLAFCRTRPFMTSIIFGATTVQQLEHILAGKDLELNDEVVADIDAVHRQHPMPY